MSPSKSNLRHMLSNHKNWFAAEHYQKEGEISIIKHTFEYKLPPSATDADFDEISDYIKQIAEESNAGYEYSEFFYFTENDSGEDIHLVVCTTDARFVNAVTNYKPQLRKTSETERQKVERHWANNRFCNMDARNQKSLKVELGDGVETPLFIITENVIIRDGPSLYEIRRNAEDFIGTVR